MKEPSLSFPINIVFMLGMMLVLPHIFGVTGVWLAQPVAEILSAMVAVYFFAAAKRRYF